jgi:hypothetical protein
MQNCSHGVWSLQVSTDLGLSGILSAVTPMNRLSKGATTLAAAYRAAISSHEGTWPDDSPLALEIAGTDAKVSHGVQEGARLAHLGLLSALDHLDGLAVLLADPGAVFSPATICRGAIEAGAMCYYLLDPVAGPREHARRYTNERLETLNETRLFAERTGQAKPAEERKAKIAELMREAKALGLTVQQPKQVWQAPFVGSKPPSTTVLVQEVLSTGDLGKNLYWFLSATAHARAHGFAQYLNVLEDTHDSTVVRTTLAVTPEQAAIRYSGANLAVVAAGARLFNRFGWDDSPLALPTQLTLAAWAEVAGIPARTFNDSVSAFHAAQTIPASFVKAPKTTTEE